MANKIIIYMIKKLMLLAVCCYYSLGIQVGIKANDTTIRVVQEKITSSFQTCMTERNASHLDKVIQDLENAKSYYWKSYANYWLSLFYVIQQNKELAEKVSNVALADLEKIKNKNSEDLALTAYLEGFSMMFTTDWKQIIVLSSSVKRHANKALQLDENNLRAYFVLGSNDFYTPEEYGGGKKAEGYFLKALSIPDVAEKPTWGRENTYDLLIQHYIKKNDWEKAKKYHKEGLELFPTNFNLNKLTMSLEGK